MKVMAWKGRVGWVELGWWIFAVSGRLRVAHVANNEFDDFSLQLGS